jgi:hypothetical protein
VCRGCWNLEAADLKAISLYCPALSHANFDYCAFSEAALAGFVTSQGAKLKELSIWWTVRLLRVTRCVQWHVACARASRLISLPL